MIAPGWGMVDVSANWMNILYVCMIGVKTQERRFTISSNAGFIEDAAAQLSLFYTFRDSFNQAMQQACPEFIVHIPRITEEWSR